MIKSLFLVRHGHSTKNARSVFSSDDERDGLTVEGVKQATRVANELSRLLKGQSCSSLSIIASTSERAEQTARIIKAKNGGIIRLSAAFNSIYSGIHSGFSEANASVVDPKFFDALRLYRLGLLSSYDIPHPKNGETAEAFEKRILRELGSLLHEELDACIIVCSRSPITAILLHYAREFLGYPKTYCGYIEVKHNIVWKIDLVSQNIFAIDCE